MKDVYLWFWGLWRGFTVQIFFQPFMKKINKLFPFFYRSLILYLKLFQACKFFFGRSSTFLQRSRIARHFLTKPQTLMKISEFTRNVHNKYYQNLNYRENNINDLSKNLCIRRAREKFGCWDVVRKWAMDEILQTIILYRMPNFIA